MAVSLLGIPLHPTLGSPSRSLDEAYERLNELPFVAEFKYDGQRAQVHVWKNDSKNPCVKIFSRHLEDMTDKVPLRLTLPDLILTPCQYPDVTSLATHIIRSSPQMNSFIIDAEIVAIDPLDGSLKSFQELSSRPRKDVQLDDIKICVCVYAFDLMYLNGEVSLHFSSRLLSVDECLLRQVLLERPFRYRREVLRRFFPRIIPEHKGLAWFDHVESCESEGGKEMVEEFWQRAVDSRCEGLMIKLAFP